MIVSGIDREFISVPDLDSAVGFFETTVGMKVVAEGNLGTDILQDLWGLPNNISGRCACLRNAKQLTALELVELNPTPTVTVRDDAELYDFGYIDVAFLVSSSDKVKGILEKQGLTYYSDPFKYHLELPGLPDGMDVIEGIATGPGKSLMAIIEMINPPAPEEMKLEGDFWVMFDMAQTVASADEAFAFYRDILGLPVVTDITVEPGLMDEMLHLPKGSTVHLAGLNHPESNGPQVEFLDLSVKGKKLECTPEKLGIFMISFESNDLKDDLAKITDGGYKVLSGPMRVESRLHGSVMAADIAGPSDLRMEFFQKT